MPADLQSIADPRLILLAWGAGLSLVGAVIAWRRIVGPGFTWLVAGVAALVGFAGAFADGAWWARGGLVLLGVSALSGRRPSWAARALGLAGTGFLVEAALFGGVIPAATATLALGGVTGEMMLGHWYLIDPRLPRSALRNLAVAGIAGLVAEAILHVSLRIGVSGGGAVGFWTLLVASVVLMAAVIGALRYPAYSGVMAATGLSYLALLTTLGAVFVGRALAAGLGPFDLG